ncbi:TetR/AcrR family transcriptional regulator [Mangrovibacterium lignilyticum]|uniref:TetR/AcrR family transcriptional regulator n=1 Tax=Mangrovibacterium lignilyticum TaxID=2668052 RepID=UPI0013CFEAD9|nr:TetR/AcrR family transcriptional regulator [Mangrovibacterium lignilyticum]
MPRTEEQFEQIRKEKKQIIMDVALELFAKNGFHVTSISQIAKQAGISKGLAYNYFKSKNDILEEIIKSGFGEISNLMIPPYDGSITDDEFITFLEHSFDKVGNDIQHWKLFYSLMLQPNIVENFTERYAAAAEPFFSMMHQFITSKGSADPEGDLMIISAMIEGAFLYAVVASGIFPHQQMKQKVIDGVFRIIETGKKQQS